MARAGGIPIGLDADGQALDRPDRWSLARRLADQLEAEYDRWFLWLPVVFGSGVAGYFALPYEPPLFVALLPVVAVLALRIGLAPRGLAAMTTSAVLAAALGFAVGKLRTE